MNEPPVRIQLTGGAKIYENGSIGDRVGHLVCDNPEPDELVVYYMININGNQKSTDFYINGTGLYLNTTLRYEHVSTYELVIRALDNGQPPQSSEETVTVTVKPTDPCALNTSGCNGNATCGRLGPNSATCLCLQGFTGNGKECQNVPDCLVTRPDVNFTSSANSHSLGTLCGNGGTCIDGIGNYTCLCPLGWTGRGCRQEIVECLSNPCAHGHCADHIPGYSCSCDDGFTGTNCEVNTNNNCSLLPCGPGTCIDAADGFNCSCPPSYAGYRCSFPVDECQHNACDLGLTCVPRAVNPKGKTGFVVANQSSQPYCVPSSDISRILLPRAEGGLANEFGQFVEDNLFQSVLVSSVYILKSDPVGDSVSVHFVAIVDDGDESKGVPLSENAVLVQLNKSCWSGAHGRDSKMFCDAIRDVAPTIPPTISVEFPKPQPREGFSVQEFVWPVIGCLVVFAVVVGGALLLRIRANKKRLPLVRRKAEFHSFMPSFCQFKVFILLQRTAFTILEQNPSHVNTLL